MSKKGYNPNHPLAVKAQQEAQAKREQRDRLKDRVKALKGSGIRFIELGDLTVAYRPVAQHPHGRTFFVSTAYRNPVDRRDVWVGREIAGLRCDNWEGIHMRIPDDIYGYLPHKIWLERLFSEAI